MSIKQRPQIGANVWFVAAHYYYVPGRAAPELEYSVYQGKIRGYHTGGFTEAVIDYRCDEGYAKIAYIALNQNNPRIFDNPMEATLLAREKTEEHMRAYGWRWELWPETPPMRRSWEKYLTKEDDDEHQSNSV